MTASMWFIPGNGGSEYIYLASGAPTPWAGTGTPWTVAATSPFELAMNETSGTKYTPQAAIPIVQYEGGPPFSNGQRPRTLAYPNVTEQFTIQIYASGTANQRYERCVYLKQIFLRALNTALFNTPCLMSLNIENSGAQFFAIYRAEGQEDVRFLGDENGRGFMRLVVTVTRAPFATDSEPLADLFNVTFTSNGASSSSYNLTPFGDLIYEGTPMNLTMSGGALASASVKTIYAAVCKAVRKTAMANAISTSSTSGVNVGSSVSISVNPDQGVRTRLYCRVASPTSTLRIRVVVAWPSGGGTLYTSEWLAPASTSAAFFDLGEIDLAPAARLAASGTTLSLVMTIQAKSTSGTATGTLTWLGSADYYTWCKLTSPSVNASSTFYVTGAAGIGVEVVPAIASAANQYANNMTVEGEIPRAFKGSTLFLMWAAAGVQSDSDTITVNSEYLAQFRTLAGDATKTGSTI